MKPTDTAREMLVCRSCGSAKMRAELDEGGWINCCPERSMNELIEERHGVPALVPPSTLKDRGR